MNDIPTIRLKPKHDRRVKAGHPWIFSNELDGDVKQLPAGGAVDVFDPAGKFMGRGYANPTSLITVRLLSQRRREDIDHPAFFAERLREAVALREAVYPGRSAWRAVHGEADRLPGLVIDRFGDHLAVQISTLGMEVRMDALRQAIEEVFQPKSVVLRNDAKVRELEGLECGRSLWWGDLPDEIRFEDAGVTFALNLLGGQKTGHFFDQSRNRAFAGGVCAGRTVLDVYANTGGWALQALKHGATHATVVDSDEGNGLAALNNARINGFGDRLTAIHGEAKRTLQAMVGEGERFGAVMLDPPAFAKQRKAAGSALRGYREINALGMMLVEEGGFFFTSSCSFHVFEDRFLDAIQQAAADAGRRLRLIRRGEQAPDHPVLLAVPETRYLKSLAFQVHAG